MRVLVTACAWPTHFLPMVPLCWALTAAGHDVRVVVPPALVPTVTGAGAVAVPAGRDVDFTTVVRAAMAPAAGDERLDPRALRAARGARSMGMFATVADAMLDDVLRFARWWQPDAVVYDPTAHAGRIAAAVLDVPAIRHLFGPDLMVRGAQFEPTVLAPLLERADVHLDTLRDALTLDPCPVGLQSRPAPTRHPMRFVPYNGPGSVPGWLQTMPDRPRVLVTAGTGRAAVDPRRSLVAKVAELLAGTEVEVLAAVAPAQRALVPNGVRVAESVPLNLLLPKCAAVVHHGGAGTMLTTMVAGLPALGVAQAPEQAFNVGELARSGAGIASTLDELSAADLHRLRTDLRLADTARETAAEMRAAPTPADVVGLLEKLAG